MWSQEIGCEYVRGLVGFMDSFHGGSLLIFVCFVGRFVCLFSFQASCSAFELTDLLIPFTIHLCSPLQFFIVLFKNLRDYGL